MFGNADYVKGKQMRLAGLPIEPMPTPKTHSQKVCDLRCGWLVADNNKTAHPDWTDAKILAD